MSKSNMSTRQPTDMETASNQTGAPAALPPPPPAPERKKRSPNKPKSFLVNQKEAELRDARIMAALILDFESLTEWGRELFLAEANKLPRQPALPNVMP